ncbi:MAG: cytochrome c biogenesis protein CcsA [Bacteroides sp.]|nr:cytochrome c biogenesis protein CcsA [Bacteroides sp.]
MNNLKHLSVAAYVIVTIALAVTTFISPAVYGSAWFILLWTAFAAVLTASIIKTRMWNNAPRFLLHVSLLAILAGGALTYLTQEKGSVRIAPGEEVSTFLSADNNAIPLPQPITLEKFEVMYYPGGIVARDYVSHLSVGGEKFVVSMNKIVDLKGYRLLQASYDSEGATILSVNHDPYGITLSYAGYVLFAIGGVWLLIAPGGRFRQLIRNVSLIVLLSCGTSMSHAASIDGVPRQVADSLRSQQVVYEGRVVCFNTLARDVVTKLYGKPSFRGLTPEQTLLSLKLFPQQWKDQPLLKIKDKEIRKSLGIAGNHASLSQLFDSVGDYRVERLYASLGEKRARAVEELDEKVGIILELYSGNLIVTPDPDLTPLSPTRVKIELLYNSIPFTTIVFITLFCGFFAGMLQIFRVRKGLLLTRMLLIVALTVSAICFIFQWYLSERLPLSNTFETLLLVVLITECLLILVAWRNALLLPLGMLMAGALALVAHMVEMNPVVTPLMPVLHSGWLSLHVTLVMTAYAILGFTFINSVTALIMKSSVSRLSTLSEALLYPGIVFLGLGIFTGAVWANVSWGQYWSWDPKETWALITLLVYSLPLHKSIPFFRRPRCLHIYLLFAILVVAMTYFGVNHLNSMHAYN